jgi:hypothetical protein
MRTDWAHELKKVEVRLAADKKTEDAERLLH